MYVIHQSRVEMTVIVSQTNVRENKRDIQEWTTRNVGNIGHTGHNTKTNETKTKKQQNTKKIKRWASRTPSKTRGWTKVLSKGKQFLLLIRRPSCYSKLNIKLPQVKSRYVTTCRQMKKWYRHNISKLYVDTGIVSKSYMLNFLHPIMVCDTPVTCRNDWLIDWFIVLNATFSNISAISRRPVSVVEEAGVPGENHQPWVRNW